MAAMIADEWGSASAELAKGSRSESDARHNGRMSGWEDVAVIRSAQNAKVKRVRGAQAGKEAGVVVLEGERLVRDAVASGWAVELALIAEGAFELERVLERAGEPGLHGAVAAETRAEVAFVDAELLARVSGLKSGARVVALAREPSLRALADLEITADALVLVIDGVQDPTNLGALVRSAEAAGACAIVHVAGGAAPFHPRALRGSMGSLLRMPVYCAVDRAAVVAGLASKGVRLVRPDTRGGTDWRALDWSGAVALWIGGEVSAADVDAEGVTIAMTGAVESLNVTVAAALLMFAAGRVR
jgi:RNA methyltransferase, TrmH family